VARRPRKQCAVEPSGELSFLPLDAFPSSRSPLLVHRVFGRWMVGPPPLCFRRAPATRPPAGGPVHPPRGGHCGGGWRRRPPRRRGGLVAALPAAAADDGRAGRSVRKGFRNGSPLPEWQDLKTLPPKGPFPQDNVYGDPLRSPGTFVNLLSSLFVFRSGSPCGEVICLVRRSSMHPPLPRDGVGAVARGRRWPRPLPWTPRRSSHWCRRRPRPGATTDPAPLRPHFVFRPPSRPPPPHPPLPSLPPHAFAPPPPAAPTATPL